MKEIDENYKYTDVSEGPSVTMGGIGPIPDNEIYVLLVVICKGKEYVTAVRHDNTSQSEMALSKAGDRLITALRLTARKKGWVKHDWGDDWTPEHPIKIQEILEGK